MPGTKLLPFINCPVSILLVTSGCLPRMPMAAPAFSNFQVLRFAGEWIENAGLKSPSVQSRWPTAMPLKEPDFSTLRGTAELMLSLRLTGRGNRLLTRRFSRVRDLAMDVSVFNNGSAA